MPDAMSIITVRASSTRLPGKCFLPIVDRVQAIQVVIRRALKVGVPVVLATSTDSTDDPLADIAEREGIGVFRGALLNKLHRWHACAASFGIDRLLMVDGDDLAFDYDIGRRVLARMDDGHDLYTCPPDIVCGLFTSAFTRTAIEKLFAVAPDPATDTDVIDHFVAKAGLRSVAVDLRPEERGKTVRLTLDYPEDAAFFRALYKAVPWDATGREIVEAALKQGIWTINWSRQADYMNNQQRFNQKVAQSDVC